MSVWDVSLRVCHSKCEAPYVSGFEQNQTTTEAPTFAVAFVQDSGCRNGPALPNLWHGKESGRGCGLGRDGSVDGV